MKPASTTIKWATIAGSATTVLWGLVDTFSDVEPSAMLISGSTAFAASLVGKLVKERRYSMTLNPK